MRSRIRCSSVGCVERSNDSTQPVHSWNESQITGGRLGLVIASAILVPMPRGNPIPAAITVQNFRKSLRETPPSFFLISSESLFRIDPPSLWFLIRCPNQMIYESYKKVLFGCPNVGIPKL